MHTFNLRHKHNNHTSDTTGIATTLTRQEKGARHPSSRFFKSIQFLFQRKFPFEEFIFTKNCFFFSDGGGLYFFHGIARLFLKVKAHLLVAERAMKENSQLEG